jgi:hypothetical protein
MLVIAPVVVWDDPLENMEGRTGSQQWQWISWERGKSASARTVPKSLSIYRNHTKEVHRVSDGIAVMAEHITVWSQVCSSDRSRMLEVLLIILDHA